MRNQTDSHLAASASRDVVDLLVLATDVAEALQFRERKAGRIDVQMLVRERKQVRPLLLGPVKRRSSCPVVPERPGVLSFLVPAVNPSVRGVDVSDVAMLLEGSLPGPGMPS